MSNIENVLYETVLCMEECEVSDTCDCRPQPFYDTSDHNQLHYKAYERARNYTIFLSNNYAIVFSLNCFLA